MLKIANDNNNSNLSIKNRHQEIEEIKEQVESLVKIPIQRAESIRKSRSRSQSPDKHSGSKSPKFYKSQQQSQSPENSPKNLQKLNHTTSSSRGAALNTSRNISMASPKLDTTRASSSHFKASGGGLKNLASLGNSASSLNNLETTQNEEIYHESENNSTSITTVSKKVITKSNVRSVSDFVNKMDKKFNSYGVARANLPDTALAKSVQSKSNSPKTSPKITQRSSISKTSPKMTQKSSISKTKSPSPEPIRNTFGGSSGNLNKYRKCDEI